MFSRFRKNEPHILDAPIAKILIEMETYGPETPEYKNAIKQLDRLMKMKAKDSPKRISPDAVLSACAYLAGIGIIVAYEQKHVLVSKALSFIQKPK